jgi:hypothetical protein
MLAAHPREEGRMRRILATLVALSLVMSMFTGVFAPVPEARAAGPAAVNLGTAGNFVILAETGISTTGTTHVTGDIGVSPAHATFITGFGLNLPAGSAFSTSALVTGKVYAADYAPPTPINMGIAVGDMETAYTNAANTTIPTPTVGLGAGTIALGTILAPGVYKWSTGVTIPNGVTLNGGPNDVWIFQIAGTLDIAVNQQVLLTGGAQAKNIFWQVAGAVTLLPGSHFEGIILAKTNIAIQTGATLTGRALAQTEVALDGNSVLPPPYILTYTAGANGTITGTTSQTVNLGASGTPVTAVPSAGYYFVTWSDNVTTASRTDTSVTADKTLAATFAQLGTITVIKNTVPDGPQDFSFTIAGGLYASTFSLDDDADGTLSNTHVFSGLPGTYTVTEGATTGYTLTNGTTSSDLYAATVWNLPARTATVTLAAWGSPTVTFTNTQDVPDIHLSKSVSPQGAVLPGARLTYTVTYTNSGTAWAQATITDVLDGWLDESSLTISSWATYDALTRTITWGMGANPGESYSMTFSVNVRSIQNVFLLIHNTALYTSTLGGNGHSNTVETPVLPIVLPPVEPPVIPPSPSIAINVTAQEPLCVDAYLPYRICFTNGTQPFTYTVDFGDGTPIVTGTTSSSCVTLEHAFLDVRQYTVYITVKDGKGLESTYRETFTTEDCTEKVVVYHHNFFIGYPNGTFQPEGNITRAEISAAMSRALGLGWSNEQPGFPDVKPTHWAAGFITLMKQEGFMQGDTGGTFRPDEPMTRAEAAAVFLRIAGMTPVLNPSSSSFKDVQPMSWAAGYIEAARQAGLLAGYPDNTFRPADLLSRAEFATLASNALGRQLTSTNSLVNPEYVVQWPDVSRDFWAYDYISEVTTPHTVTNPTRLTRIITLKERKIPLFTEGVNGIVTFLRVGDTIIAIVPVDGLQPDGSDPAPRTVKVRIINHERP